MSSFRSLSSVHGGSFGESVSLTVPLGPYQAAAAGPAQAASPAEVRFAGVDTKEKMYEPKQRKKLVRVLTVVAYLFFVSLAAAMLSLYYVFLWNPSPRDLKGKDQHLYTGVYSGQYTGVYHHHHHLHSKKQQLDEQLRVEEQQARQVLERIQEQRTRFQEQIRVQEQLERQLLERQLAQQVAWSSTLSPDYADFTGGKTPAFYSIPRIPFILRFASAY